MAFIRIADQQYNVYTRHTALTIDVFYPDDPSLDETHFVLCTPAQMENVAQLKTHIEESIRLARAKINDVVGTEWKTDKL